MEDEDLSMRRRQNLQRLMQCLGAESEIGIGFRSFHLSFGQRLNRSLFTNPIPHKSGRFMMGNAIEPGTESLRHLQRFKSAKCVEPNFLVQIERVFGTRDESTKIIEQRLFVAIDEANKSIGVAGLGFSHPKHFLESRKFLLR